MADLNLRVVPKDFEKVKAQLDELAKDRTVNLHVATDKGVESLLKNLNQIEGAALAAKDAMDALGSNKGGLKNVKTNLKDIWQTQTKIISASGKIKSALTGTDKHLMSDSKYKIWQSAFDNYKKQLAFYESKAKNGSLTDPNDIQNLNTLIRNIDKGIVGFNKYKATIEGVNKASKNKVNYDIAMDKIGNKLTDYQSKYGEQLSKNIKLQNKWQTLLNKANSGGFTSVAEANREFAAFRVAARQAGIEAETFGTKLQKAFGSKMRSQLSGYGIMAIEMALRDIVQNSIAVDTAMTELKKVTSETDAVYTQFLEGAEARAQKLGATLSEVVNATADYARLGYNIDQATTLADSALIYSNVGDDVNSIDDATGALISTMQGFNIAAQDSMTIVDKFNNVSNNYASSAGDIGEIVRRSAASMSAAGNSLDQTIALGVAANEVQQDADTVGTALKTKFVLMYRNMRLSTHLKPVKPKALSLQCG